MVSEAFEQQVGHEHSEEAIFFLLTIESSQLDQPLYLVNNNEDVYSRGIRFEPFPFDLKLPPETGGPPQSLQLTTYNLGEQMMDLIRQTTEPPLMKFELVSSRDLDLVEKSINFMEVRGAEYDAIGVQFTLSASSFAARKTLQASYQQIEFPGLFYALQ